MGVTLTLAELRSIDRIHLLPGPMRSSRKALERSLGSIAAIPSLPRVAEGYATVWFAPLSDVPIEEEGVASHLGFFTGRELKAVAQLAYPIELEEGSTFLFRTLPWIAAKHRH